MMALLSMDCLALMSEKRILKTAILIFYAILKKSFILNTVALLGLKNSMKLKVSSAKHWVKT